jgi:hypothetical protein
VKYFKYLSYVLRHKWYVFLECCKVGMVWQGIVHDLSKLLPSEFVPYANHFFGENRNVNRGRDKTGYYKPTDTGDKDFDFAWLLHQKRNRHHWQWWVLPEDGGGVKVLNMFLEYRKEMLCDWRGAGRAQGNRTAPVVWYQHDKDKMQLHKDTRRWVENHI